MVLSLLRTPSHKTSAKAARKAKEKKQQSETDKSPAKPKTYTNDDIPESKSSAASAKPGSAPSKEDSATVTLSLAKSTSPRTDVNWSVHKHFRPLHESHYHTCRDGPCGFRQEHPLRFSLNPGGHGGIGDKSLGTAFYQDNCPGQYTFELRAMSYNKLLSMPPPPSRFSSYFPSQK